MRTVLVVLVTGFLAVCVMPARFRLVIWTLIIVAGVTPWRSFQDHAHWENIRWLPFVSPPVRVVDIVGNVLLYVPFGYFVVANHPAAQRWRQGVLLAVLLSCATEYSQIWSHGRIPSVQDVLMNVLGAAVGIQLASQTTRNRSLMRNSYRVID